MARVKQLDVITGSIKNLSFYTRKGSDQVFVRTKGGASKEKIKRSPAFEGLRKVNKEFGGCSKMSKEIRSTFTSLAHVADFNLSSVLCSVAKNIQKMDVVNMVGERNLFLSNYRQYLTGFDFNRAYRFDSVLRIPLQWNIDRELQTAVVDIPAFACSLGLYLPGKYSMFRIAISLGVATDMQLNPQKNGYETTHPKLTMPYKPATTVWYSTQATVSEQQLMLDISETPSDFCDADTLILSIAIEFGELDAFGNPVAMKYGGAGKILGTK
ncbi:MAG: hypothetical protein WCG93_05300 [Paludibacter sp.]